MIVASQGVKSELVQKDEISLYDTKVGVVSSKIEGKANSLTFEQNGFKTTVSKIDTTH